MAVKVTIDFTFPTFEDYFEFMSSLDTDFDHIPFTCKAKKAEED